MDKPIVTLNVSELKLLISEVIDAKLLSMHEIKATLPKAELPKFMTRREVADLFGVSLVSVDKWKKHGILPPPIKQSGRTYFLRKDIDKMIEDKFELNNIKP
jgi:predicted DNA-binding transcriptional regulator AlpA